MPQFFTAIAENNPASKTKSVTAKIAAGISVMQTANFLYIAM